MKKLTKLNFNEHVFYVAKQHKLLCEPHPERPSRGAKGLNFSIFSFLIFLFVLSSYSFAYIVRSDHPRVFINSENIDDIRARCSESSGVQGDYYSRLKQAGDSYIDDSIEGSSNEDLWLYAFLYAMGEIPGRIYDITYTDTGDTGINAYAARGIDILKYRAEYYKSRTAGHYEPVIDMAIGYDWLYHNMTPVERAAIVDDFISFHETNIAYLEENPNQRNISFSSHGLINPAHVFLALAWYGDGETNHPDDSIAAEADNAKAQEYLDEYVREWKNKIYPVWERATKGGGYPHGAAYANMWYKYLIKGEMWNTATYTETDNDFWEDYDGFPKYSLYFMMYNLIPYVSYLHCDSDFNPDGIGPEDDSQIYHCWEGCWGCKALKTRGVFRNTGSGLIRFSDFGYPCFRRASSSLPWSVRSITVNQEKENFDIAEASQWMLLFHSSSSQPSSETEPSEGPYYDEQSLSYLIWDIILRDEQITPKSPMELNLPKAHFFGTTNSGPELDDFPNEGTPEGNGIVTMRSAWEDPDATLVFYKHSPYPTVHYYEDAGSFQIYKNGWLAIDSGQYEETNHTSHYTRHTISKNSLVIYDPHETPPHCQDSFVPCGNSGGQRFNKGGTPAGLLWESWPDADHCDDGSIPLKFYGGIKNFKHEENTYTYIDSDLTRAYQSHLCTDNANDPKVNKVTRQLVYLPSDYVVVFDRIDSVEPEFPKRWLIHSVYRPTLVDGTETFDPGITIQYTTQIPDKYGIGVQLEGDEDAGISESYNTNVFYIDGYNFEAPENSPATGRLFVKTLLPENRIHRVVGGSDYEFMNAEYDNNPILSTLWWRSQHPEHGSWRIEVEPTGDDYPKDYNTFLHVLETNEQTVSQMVTSQLIESTSGDEMQGAFIQGNPNKIVMFAKDYEVPISETSFLMPGVEETDILICDLTPNTTYYYKIADGIAEIRNEPIAGGFQRESSDEGTLYLVASGFEYEICQCFLDGSCEGCDLYSIEILQKPEKAGSVTDPVFNTQITRITDKDIDGYDGEHMTTFYGTFSPENADGTYVLLNDQTYQPWYLYNTRSFEVIKKLTNITVDDSDVRWDACDPNVFYFTRHMGFYKYDIRTEDRILVRDFSFDYPIGSKISWAFEGEPSLDGRYWALVVTAKDPWRAHAIFSYDKIDNIILGDIKEPLPYGIDWVSMTPSGEYVVVRYSYTGGLRNIYAYTKDFTSSHIVAPSKAGHADRALDMEGNDVIVYKNDDNNWICMADIGKGETNEIKLLDLGTQAGGTYPGIHVSANQADKPGWALITIENDHQDARYWLDNSLIMLELKENPRVWRVAHHHSPKDDYWSNPFASMNREGTRIYFGSNWDTLDYTETDIYKIDIPYWWTYFTGNIPPEASAAATVVEDLTVEFSGLGTDPDGSIELYHWDFRDGSYSDEQNPTHTYGIQKDYWVSLTVTDNLGAIGRSTVQVFFGENDPPVAYASADKKYGQPPLEIQFTGFGEDPDGTYVSYHWDFGDGSTSTEQNPFHTYYELGEYTATLNVTDERGATGSDSVIITVTDAPIEPPTAIATASPGSGKAPLTVRFTGSGTDPNPGGYIVSYEWDFDDGSHSELQNPEHIYYISETYTAILTVTNNYGATGTAEVTISVMPKEILVESTFEEEDDRWSCSQSDTICQRDPDVSYRSDNSMHVETTEYDSTLSIRIHLSGSPLYIDWYIDEYPYVQFAYKIPAEVPVGLFFLTDLHSYMCLGGTSSHDHGTYNFNDVFTLIDDGEWHTITMNVKDAIRAIFPDVEMIREFEFYTYRNAQIGDEFWFDDFRITSLPPQEECEPDETQECDTGLLGVCAAGTMTCDPDRTWGNCEQDEQPFAEICDDGLDNDCDGFTDFDDSDCMECIPDETQECDTGLYGVCAAGEKNCSYGFWGECLQLVFASDEICDDLIDNDCDRLIDFEDHEDCFHPECPDRDQDGYFDESCGGHDCDDRDEFIFPDAEEICGDEIDQDCNGEDLICEEEDADGDGFLISEGDCDDSDKSINPSAEEICDDEIDNDCDTYIDDLDAQCNNLQIDIDVNEIETEISGSRLTTGGCGMIEKENSKGIFIFVLFLIVACFIFIRKKV